MREKLLELIKQADERCDAIGCINCEYREEGFSCVWYMLSDYLIKNGVVIPVCCDECAYLNEYGVCEFHYDHIRFREQFVGKNDYCSRGIPKEDKE